MTAQSLFNKCISGPWETAGDDVQYKVWHENGVKYLAFQATGNMKEYGLACDFWPVRFCGHLAHRGYVSHLVSFIRDPRRCDITEPMIICGYSLGGALALLLGQFSENCIEVITFAAPRVVFWGAKPRHKITRYENRGDPVPHLIPAIFGYKHIGDRVKIGKLSIIWHTKHYAESYKEALKNL